MALTCLTCGGYGDEQLRDGQLACTACGSVAEVQPRPVLVVTGAAGSGKSTVCAGLAGQQGILALDGDVMASGAAAVADGNRNYQEFWGYLLDVGREIHSNGLDPVYCCICLPEQILVENDLSRFSSVHFLALTCERGQLSHRILGRTGGESAKANLDFHLTFNAKLAELTVPVPHTLNVLDTTLLSTAETIAFARVWASSSRLAPTSN